jgi:chromosome segregation ATPase
MSAPASADPLKESGAVSKSKKKKNKKKAAAAASKAEESVHANGDPALQEADDEGKEDEDEQEVSAPSAPQDDLDDVDDEPPAAQQSQTSANGTTQHSIAASVALGLSRSRSQGSVSSPSPPPPSDAAARLDALAKERDTLRQEVTELRKSLENIQDKHEEEIGSLQEQLEEANGGKEHFETQYRNLLGRVNTIKSSLGDRLKADGAKLTEQREQIEELEQQNGRLQETNQALEASVTTLRKENEEQAAEIANLRSRATLSQQNWIKERGELISREAYAREEFENAKQAMQDWEVLAMDERSLRESLGEQVADLEEQLAAQKEAYERAASERDTNSQAVDGLQRALQEVQNARKAERRELVEQAQSQLEELRKQLQVAEKAAADSKVALETTQKELERALPFEKEVKEKNLLIGKLRHEAVTLNEHLTKALRILKKGRPEENVDRQIISNYILHFLALDRSDPKKFEALQLIGALLNWNDEQREQAGLARPGTSGSSNLSLKIPIMPFRRTPSSPALNTSDPMLSSTPSSNKESLAELWSDFLEREASEASNSRRGSKSSGAGLGISEK